MPTKNVAYERRFAGLPRSGKKDNGELRGSHTKGSFQVPTYHTHTVAEKKEMCQIEY